VTVALDTFTERFETRFASAPRSVATVVEAVVMLLTERLEDFTPPELLTDGRGLPRRVQWRPRRDLVTREAMPCLFVEWAGTSSPPVRSGRAWNAEWAIGAVIFDRGRDFADTQRRLALWSDAIRDCLWAHRSLGGLAQYATWLDTETALLDDDQNRTLDGAVVLFAYGVHDVMGGPLAGDGDTSVVTSTATTVSVRARQE
jgi:hypothetical protein